MFKHLILALTALALTTPVLADAPSGKVVTIVVDNSQYCGGGRYENGQRRLAERTARAEARRQRELGNTVRIVHYESPTRIQSNPGYTPPIFITAGC